MKSLINLFFRISYFIAYRLMKSYWAIRKPETNGALISIWYKGEILLVRTSYHGYYSLPGGYVKSKETAIQAAIRELKEEIGLEMKPSELELVVDSKNKWEHRRDHVTIFSVEVTEKPHIEIDNREIVSAEFYPPDEVLKLKVFPPILDCIKKHQTNQP